MTFIWIIYSMFFTISCIFWERDVFHMSDMTYRLYISVVIKSMDSPGFESKLHFLLDGMN